jgi:hypothetical protein
VCVHSSVYTRILHGDAVYCVSAIRGGQPQIARAALAVSEYLPGPSHSIALLALSMIWPFAEVVMTLRRSFVPISLAALLAACASVPTHRAPESAREITFELPTSPIRTRDQLLAAFAAHGLPVASSQPGVIEFQAPRERGILGFDEVFARAIITPLECGTRVTLFGEETHYPNATARQGSATRIGPGSSGRARDLWSKLQSIGNSLRADTAATRGGT